MRRIGLLGGSFNPAHRGHRHVTLEAIRLLGLDEAWWLVSPGNPLKPRAGMAPLAARLGSARAMARRAPIRATDLEARLRTRYTVDTLRTIVRRYPRNRFIWIMGADNLAQFHAWRQWRMIARTMPIAVLTRPGYDDDALAAPAMGWLRRYRRPARQATNWAEWSVPALVLLRFRPDRTSATQLRAVDPDWHVRFADPISKTAIPAASLRQPQE
ncbi:nicotinate-nucleotide adenylyltransferase [Sphingomonas sp. 8AM]|uniref:nicotinate-nucleotide adenylyltransferase n=1 Tax=Sphingomonas sp. 8AM TaxID=2653170 RepID=UPI0013576EAE|nr:nicotinate-nucleotide adenylyltransferase [Sphingomonas sp. 8AM]